VKTIRSRVGLLFVVAAVLFFFGTVCRADNGVYNITDYGAKGDGKTINTAAIQSAIDACNKAGSGRVLVPSGKFVTGTIIMKDNVELHVSHGAILQGALGPENYPLQPKPEFRSYIFQSHRWYSLIYAEKAKHIAVTGTGTIHGPGKHFRATDWIIRGKWARNPRIILFVSCKDIRVQDIHFRDSTFWIQHYINSENIIVRGVEVFSRTPAPNQSNDGINMDGCNQVTVSDCIFNTGDDSIVFKSTGPTVCKNIAVTNCVVTSGGHGIKFGSESHGGYENISVSNCTIRGCRGGAIGLYINDGGTLQRVTISNITAENSRIPIAIRLTDRGRKYRPDIERPGVGVIRDITISNVNIRGTNDNAPMQFEGLNGSHPLENISLNNIRISINGGPILRDYRNRKRASILYGHHIKGLRISNMQLVTDKPDERQPIVLWNIDGLVLDSIDSPESSKGLAMIRMDRVKDVMVRGCQPVGDTFIDISGDNTKNVMIAGNNFTKVKNPVVMGTEISKDEVKLLSNKAPNAKKYEPTWDSLKQYKSAPEWFRDAKFGVYAHWGPVTVGSQNVGGPGAQMYGMNMYRKNEPLFKAHRERYGDQNKFGYKDMIPLFDPDKFDAEEWADLFAASGARFAGPVAVHHDNYCMWDSAFTRWDSMDTKPKRDFVGELSKAIKARDMKFIATFHHAYGWKYFGNAHDFDAADGKNDDLYGPRRIKGQGPPVSFLKPWLDKVNEVVNKYEPELIWFDAGLHAFVPGKWQRRMFADYYNWAEARGLKVGVAHKSHGLHKQTGILDFERGRAKEITPYAWLTDTSVGPWFHQTDSKYPDKSAGELVDILVDIVSKNGCLLLNIDPKADGSFPKRSRGVLLGIGKWLKVCGEAIYETRPWHIFGERQTRPAKESARKGSSKYSSLDIRFTQSKDGKILYAIALGWPKESELTLQTVKVNGRTATAGVKMLGYKGTINYRVNDQNKLIIELPKLSEKDLPCKYAYAFRISGFDLSSHK